MKDMNISETLQISNLKEAEQDMEHLNLTKRI